jgi:hypothetical protein
MSHGGGDSGGGATEGMEEMGIFTVNIAAINPVQADDSVRTAQTNKPHTLAPNHSKMIRTAKHGMIEYPESLYPVPLL